jgi:hypothetical protein
MKAARSAQAHSRDGSLCMVGNGGYFDGDGFLYLTVFPGSLKYAKRVGLLNHNVPCVPVGQGLIASLRTCKSPIAALPTVRLCASQSGWKEGVAIRRQDFCSGWR